MMAFLVLTMVGTIVLRLVYYYMTASAMVKKSNAHRLVGAFLLMRWFDARLAWALLLLTHIVIVVGKLIARRLRKMTLEIRNSESKIQMQVQEGVEYNAVLRSLKSEKWVT